MSWEDQGRPTHGEFGHGKSLAKDRPTGARSDPMFEPTNYAPRIDAVAHAVIAQMPRKDWHHPAVTFDKRQLEQLRQAMTAWIGARSLSAGAFEETFVDRFTDSAAVGKLRAAAEGVRTAKTHQDLANASVELTGGMQDIGLSKWAGFLRDAAARAAGYRPAQSPILLAQATLPNTATASHPNAAAGGYVADNPGQWIGHPPVGTGECVPLVQKATGAPRSSEWRPGALVKGNTAIRPGTAVATFDKNGRYDGHAAIYLGQDQGGIHVIDQWNNRDPNSGQITSPHAPSERTIPFNDPKRTLVNRGESYNVIK